MDNTIFKQETLKLKNTQQILIKAKASMQHILDKLGKHNIEQLSDLKNNPETSAHDFMQFVQQLSEKNESLNVPDKLKRLEEMDYLIKEAYFARIDLSNTDDTDLQEFYIGKFGFTDPQTKAPVVTDWRTKVASIYYRYRFPQKNVKYSTKDNEYTKNLHLKRTFEIDNGELVKYYNNDLQLDENEIITSKIKQRTGGVLEDIIATIHESQLDIIESDPRKVCIVQGAVGSGKSTVAIHKLSHIFFHYENIIKPERSILIAKSNVLVSYLATLFPKLGIFDVNYKTLRDLVVNLIFRQNIKYKYNLDDNTTIVDFPIEKVQILERLLNEIHSIYEHKIQKFIDSNEKFQSLASYKYSSEVSVQENITELINDLSEELAMQKAKIKDNPKSLKVWIYTENIKTLRKMIVGLQKMRLEVKDKTLDKILSSYEINKKTVLNYQQVLVYLYIHYNLFGYKDVVKYQYCVVDEGQDFSPLEYLVLSTQVQNGRFCILGDLNQSYLEEGINDWEIIKQVIKEAKQAQTFKLTTNYRSTKPIIDLANKILTPYTTDYLPLSINRVGEDPQIHAHQDLAEIKESFTKLLSSDMKDLDNSIGIITLDDEYYEMANNVIDELQKIYKIPEHNIIKLKEKDTISYLPKGIYLSKFETCKGLEFSKVYILGLNIDKITTFKQAKKAFVAVTRAMNQVIIYGTNK